MEKRQTGRAIVHYSFKSNLTGKTYNSILLGLERKSGLYSLPGGGFDTREGDKDTLDTAIRELEDEFGIKASESSAQKVYTFEGRRCIHDVYVLEATGTVHLQHSELKGLGLFNAGRRNQIPDELLEPHVQELTSKYYHTKYERKSASDITIPEELLRNLR